MNQIVATYGLTKKYKDFCAVSQLDMTVREGRIYGFLGPNGAGKSTTLKMLLGLVQPSTGSIELMGKPMNGRNRIELLRNTGSLIESPSFYGHLTARENLRIYTTLLGLPEKNIDEVLQIVRLDRQEGKKLSAYSLGMKQRFGIASAMLGFPKLLILDEPTNGLDPKQIIDIRNLIRELGKERTIILSTHILSEVKAVCDRILIINEGKIVANEKTENIESALRGNRRIVIRIDGPSASVLSSLKKINGVVYAEISQKFEDGSAVYIVESGNAVDVRKPIFYMLAQNSWPILSLEFAGANLEDILISVVDEAEAEESAAKHGKTSA